MQSELERYDGDQAPWQEILPEELGVPQISSRAAQRVKLWALTLDARSLPCQIDNAPDGLRLLVPPERHAAAIFEIRRFEELNRDWPPTPPPPRPLAENTLATLSVLILLASFHNLTHLDPAKTFAAMPEWLEIGSARAALILNGQWWRIITSLTLHSDVVHLLSNLSIGAIFVFLLCRQLGSGLAWSLILASGAFGNLVNAVVQPASHSSVGASTAVFGAVGILAALNQLRYRDYLRRRWTLPVAASLALLALLGSEGKQTDLGAHLFGLLSGICIGFATEWLVARRGLPGAWLNILLALSSSLVVLLAWWLAIMQG